MTDENNKQDLNKVYELIQKNSEQIIKENRWNRVTNLVMLIPTFILIYKSFQKKKLTPKQRLMRNRAAQARLKLDEEYIMREAFHETELKKMETGLDVAESKIDLLSGLKQKGQNLLKNQLNQVNKVVDDQIKSATDKLKVDQFLAKEKKEK